MAGVFTYNPECEVIIKSSPLLEPQMSVVAKAMEATAKSIAPVDTGRFQASLTGEVSYDGGLIRARLSTDVEYAQYLEYGTSDTPTFATLRRSLYGRR